MSNGVAVNMPMSYEVRFKSRRLLFVEEDLQAPSVYTYENEYDILSHEDVHEIMHRPLWNLSSTPCSSLAYAYQNHVKLGILEEHELHKCAYWRHVGSNIIRDFNLTALKNKETFLVSLDDLSAAIVQKDAFVQVLREPRLLIKIAVMHPYIKPLRALFILSANMLEEKIHELQKITNTSQLPNMDELVRSIADKLEVKIDQNINRTRTLNKIKNKIKSKKTGKRKLLTTISDIQAVQEYSSQVIQGAQSPPLALVVAQSWIRGPFAWPPKYSYSISDCTIVSVVWQALKEIVYVTINYFRHFNDPTPAIDRSLKGNLPGIKVYGNTVNYTITKSYKTWNQWIYYSTLDLLHIQPQDIIEFLIGENKWNLMWIVQTSISCDLGTVMSCSRHTRDLFASIFVFILFYFMIYFIGNALGWPSLSTIFLLNFPLFMLWYVYGMAPSCLPMLPTCLLDDIVSMVERTFPPNIYFPTPLYCEQSVPEFFPNASVCLKSCKDIGFTEFFDSFTYSICSYDSVLCSQLQGLTTSIQPLSNSFGRMYNVTVLNQDLAAWNFCMWIEFVNTIPIIIVFLVLVSVAAGSLYAILSLIPAFVGLFTQYLVYNHT